MLHHWSSLALILFFLFLIFTVLSVSYLIYRSRMVSEAVARQYAFGGEANGGRGVAGIDAAAALEASRSALVKELNEGQQHLDEMRKSFEHGIKG